MSNLPPDAIGDILSRLPVKSVCRFKCVSKLWLRLTHEPHFIAAHLNRHQKQKVILSSGRSLFSLDPEAPIDDDMLPSELEFPLKSDLNNNWIQMFGSCNGLVCIMPQPEVFFVFNPSTRESMRIPDCPRQSDVDPPNGAGFHIHSFGYAPSANDYKFIKIFYGRIVLVFSLKSKTWKTVRDFPFNNLLNEPGTPLNGVMHWFCLGLGEPPVIAAFDLSEEKISGLPPPESIGESQSLVTGALRGCLCLLYYNDPNRQRTFWIMNEYGVKESWTKILIAEPYRLLKPLCNWKNTKILVARNLREILLFNQRDGTCKNLLANGLQVPFHADVYVESLVSPNILQN